MFTYVSREDPDEKIEAVLFKGDKNINKVLRFLDYPEPDGAASPETKQKVIDEFGLKKGKHYIVKDEDGSFLKMNIKEFEGKYKLQDFITKFTDGVEKLKEKYKNKNGRKVCLGCGNEYEPENRQQKNNCFCSPECCKNYKK